MQIDTNANMQIDKVRKCIIPLVFALKRIRCYLTDNFAMPTYTLTYLLHPFHRIQPVQELKVLQHQAVKCVFKLPYLKPSVNLHNGHFISVDNIICLNLTYIHVESHH